MYHYFVYGFRIESEIELPPLMPTAENPDQRAALQIRLAHDDEYLCADVMPGLSILNANEKELSFEMIRLYWRTVGCFSLVSQFGIGSLIVRPLPNLEPAILSNFIVSNLLGIFLLTHPQIFVFHASAIRIRADLPIRSASSHGTGIALAGRSGAGKSTLAAALIQRGHHLLADDLTVVNSDMLKVSDPGYPDILAAFPQLKLDDASLKQIAVDPASLPHIHSAETKRAYRPQSEDLPPTPLRALYLLDDDDAPVPSIEPLSRQDTFAAFIGASYNAHLNDLLDVDVLDTIGRTNAFMGDCAGFTKSVRVRRLKRPRDLSRLNEIVDYLEADVKTL